MARNKVQFQRGLLDVEFDRLYGSEEKCREAQFSWRWPGRFECPACGCIAHCELEKRALWQCNACRVQTSLTVGTIFASTKLNRFQFDAWRLVVEQAWLKIFQLTRHCRFPPASTRMEGSLEPRRRRRAWCAAYQGKTWAPRRCRSKTPAAPSSKPAGRRTIRPAVAQRQM